MNNQKIEISKKEYVINILLISLIICIVAKLFYGSFAGVVVIVPLGILLLRQRKEKIILKRTEQLETAFKDMLISVSDALRTGYSIENAIRESYRDLLPAYGYDSIICREVRLMISRLNLNVNVESVITEFADRMGIGNAELFARMFITAKRTGGNMVEIIRNVTDDIVLKEAVKEEIRVMMNSKKTEQKVMSVIPLFLLLYINITSPGFFDVMYESVAGKCVMTVCLICYAAAYMWGEKITKLEV